MAVPDFDQPSRRNMPLPAGAAARPQPAGSANRPIPVQSRAGELPGAFDRHDDDDDDEATDDLKEVLRNAPSWLVSTVFHMLLLIILGLLAVSTAIKLPEMDIAVAPSELEQMGYQTLDDTVLEGTSSVLENPHDEKVITPKDLPPVNDPLASPLEVGELKLGPGPQLSGPTVIPGAPIGLALKGREKGSKNVLLGKYGGSRTTEEAVERGLEWLAKQQRGDGTWSLSGPYSNGTRSENVVAATAMALLAFQGHGDTHREGRYSKLVAKGWDALLKMQKKDSGLFAGSMAEKNQLLYAHAQATIALCELYGMTQDSHYRGPAEKAIAYAVEAQDKKYGGWRYEFGFDSDTSVTGWFVMALQSAKMAGLRVPEETLQAITGYLDRAQLDDGRRYGYWLDTQPSHAVCAEGLLCRQYLGWAQNDPRLVEGIGALNKSPVDYEGPGRDAYYWYYATQATHHMEGNIWNQWNAVMSKEVPAHQTKNGPETGSWAPEGDKWGNAGGRLYITCLSIYMLEVYYRHLPIYSGYKALAAAPSVAPELKIAPEPKATETDKPADGKAETKPNGVIPDEKPAAPPDKEAKGG